MSPSVTARRAWVWRAMLAASVGVATAAAAHVMFGGHLPGMLGFLPALVLTTFAGLVLLRRGSTWGIITTVLCGQWLFHELAILGSPYSAPSHAHHGSATWSPTIVDDTPMAVGHLVAASITAVAIALAQRIRRAIHTTVVLLASLIERWVVLPGLPVVTAPAAVVPSAHYAPDIGREINELVGFALRAPPRSA